MFTPKEHELLVDLVQNEINQSIKLLGMNCIPSDEAGIRAAKNVATDVFGKLNSMYDGWEPKAIKGNSLKDIGFPD